MQNIDVAFDTNNEDVKVTLSVPDDRHGGFDILSEEILRQCPNA